jgi:hypothetical protein
MHLVLFGTPIAVRLVSTEPTFSRWNLPDKKPCLSGDQGMMPMPILLRHREQLAFGSAL